MKRTLIAAGIAAAALLAASCNQNQGSASSPAAGKDSVAVAGSIVFFNMDKVMEGYDMANDLTSVFETKSQGVQAEIERRGKKLEKNVSDFQNKVDKGLITSSVAQAQYQKLQQQQQEYQQYVLAKQQEMGEEQQAMMNQIADAVAQYVEEFNMEHGYAMILATAGNLISTPVVTADPSLDITDELLAGLNAAYIKSKESSRK